MGASSTHSILDTQLKRVPGTKRVMSTSTWICCPLPEHGGERTPSCKVTTDPTSKYFGLFYCFGCGGKGHYNKLASLLRLQPLREVDMQTTHTHRPPHLRESVAVGVEAQLLDHAHTSWGVTLLHNITEEWRGIPESLLSAVGAKAMYDTHLKDHAIVLPVLVLGRCVGAIKAKREKDAGGRSYINSVGEWSKGRGLFPYDYVKETLKTTGIRTIVLVEGPRDALRLIGEGIPAISIIGAKSWGESKINLLLALDVGILLCFDGDRAGVGATNAIRKTLLPYIDVDFIRMMDYSKKWSKKRGQVVKIDPANCGRDVLDDIRSRLK